MGGLIWVCRATRPDITASVNRPSQRLVHWTAYEDVLLERVFRYLWHTRFLVLQQEMHPGDYRHLLKI